MSNLGRCNHKQISHLQHMRIRQEMHTVTGSRLLAIHRRSSELLGRVRKEADWALTALDVRAHLQIIQVYHLTTALAKDRCALAVVDTPMNYLNGASQMLCQSTKSTPLILMTNNI